MKPTCRIGLFGIGLDAYWPQFKGLKPRLTGYLRAVEQKLSRPGVEVVNLGPDRQSEKSPRSRSRVSRGGLWT